MIIAMGLALGAVSEPARAQTEGADATEAKEAAEAGAPVTPPAAAPGKRKVSGPSLPSMQPQPTLSREARREAFLAALPTTTAADPNPDVMHFAGTCGASTAFTLDDERVIVGSDDDNLIRTYDLVEPAALRVKDESGKPNPKRSLLHRPRASQNVYKFLKVNQFSRRNFSAFEGTAVGDGFVFWTGSHARREDGENRPNRRRFFATRIAYVAKTPIIEPYGKPVMDLLQQLETADTLQTVGLSRSIMSMHRRLEHLSPELRGIEIQALSMAADGKTVLIGLRNPQRGEDAILVPLVNPVGLADGERAIFADPILLPLGGRGISAMEWVPELNAHLVVAGEKNAHDGFVLYRWSGKPGEAPVQVQSLPEGFDVQAFIVSADGARLLVFSDDSSLRFPVSDARECGIPPVDGTCACSDLKDYGPKYFRALWIPLETAGTSGEAAAGAKPSAPAG